MSASETNGEVRDALRAKWRRDNARRAAAKRAWENEHDRGKCACGETLCVGSRRRGTALCKGCHLEAIRVQRVERAERIAALWADGSSRPQIAAALGMTLGHLGVEMVAIRREGWADLPLRRPYYGNGR